MNHVGDVTKLDGAKLEPVWCITGGSPCQDLSVAGKGAARWASEIEKFPIRVTRIRFPEE